MVTERAGTEYPLCDECVGICDSANGCMCIIQPYEHCVPTSCIMESNGCCPLGYYWNSSASCCTDELSCSPACAGDEVCVRRGVFAVCECDLGTYIGATIADIKPSVACDGATMTITVSKCLLTYLGYDYSSLHIGDDSEYCSFHYSEMINDQRMENIQLRAAAGFCGNTDTVDESHISYSNTLYILPSPLVTKCLIEVNFTCSYSLAMMTSLPAPLISYRFSAWAPVSGSRIYSPSTAASTFPWEYSGTDIVMGIITQDADGSNVSLIDDQCIVTASNDSTSGPMQDVIVSVYLTPVLGGGSFDVTMAAYKDPAYVTLWEDEEIVSAGGDVYLGIFTPDADAHILTLSVHQCFATASNDWNDVTRVPLVIDRVFWQS
uniref:ZP domain-containing protein n=1 Tax=Leptobrachium leishanense TaxID=445787 RepID=A0A8C5LTH5_9ANUR